MQALAKVIYPKYYKRYALAHEMSFVWFWPQKVQIKAQIDTFRWINFLVWLLQFTEALIVYLLAHNFFFKSKVGYFTQNSKNTRLIWLCIVLGIYFGPGANFEGDTRGFFCFLSYNLHDTTYCLPLLYDFFRNYSYGVS